MPPLSVLVVDDEGGIRKVLTRALGRMGLSVQTAMSGEEACEILSDNEVDLVLMDLRMPSMSGQTLYHMIATQWPHLADRVIVMSGDPEAQDHEDWLGLHDLPVLTKPFEIQQLLDLVTRLTASERREANGQ
jgi:CheY-like chemotaxis protein